MTRNDAKRPFAVCAFSDALTDISFHCDEDELSRLGLTWSRSVRLDALQQERLKERFETTAQYELHAGGSPANTICGLSRMGVPCVFMGVVGNDAFAERYISALERAGVTARVVTKSGNTGVCYTLVSSDGERSFGIDLGVANRLLFEEFDFSAIAQAEVFHTSAYQLRGGPDAKKILFECFKQAREHNVRISLDLGDPGVVDQCREEIDFLLSQRISILQANIHEARALFSDETLPAGELARRMNQFADVAVVTQSEQGCSVVSGETVVEMPALKVENVVDFNGAGDAFSAGFLFGQIQKLSIRRSIQIGQYHAALVIQQVGAQLEKPVNDIATLAERSFATISG